MEKAEVIMKAAKRHPFIARLAASVLLALFGLAQPANAQDGAVGQLAYVGSGGDGDFDIYVSDASGDGFVDLSRNDVWDSGAVFSPDGRRIAFWTDRHGDRSVPLGYRNVEIYVMDADGSNVRRLTHHEAWDANPSWSNDGRRIAFESWRNDVGDIYVMDAADGSGVVNLTNTDDEDAFPKWSPDGRHILFASREDPDEQFDLYVMRADGSDVRQLTTSGSNIPGGWSPNGRRIVFQHDNQVFVMEADGSGKTRLAAGPTPRWSFNGRHISYSRHSRPWIMDADGSNPRRIPTPFSGRTLHVSDWSHPRGR